MKTLVDEIRDIVGEARTRGMYPVLTDAASELLGRSCWSEEDARKMFNDYWGCGDVECLCCPSKVDGKKPHERYGTDSCANAQRLDLLHRQRKVLEMGQE